MIPRADPREDPRERRNPTGALFKRCSPFQQWPETLLEDSPESLKDFQLKEKLYLDAIGYLDKGKVSDLFYFI